jgi:hypothetical protein
MRGGGDRKGPASARVWPEGAVTEIVMRYHPIPAVAAVSFSRPTRHVTAEAYVGVVRLGRCLQALAESRRGQRLQQQEQEQKQKQNLCIRAQASTVRRFLRKRA